LRPYYDTVSERIVKHLFEAIPNFPALTLTRTEKQPLLGLALRP
jgi:hypothetical protein